MFGVFEARKPPPSRTEMSALRVPVPGETDSYFRPGINRPPPNPVGCLGRTFQADFWMTGFAAIVFSGREWILPATAVALASVVAILWALYRGRADRWVQISCGLLKTVGVIALALCLLDPLWVGQRARPGANVFAVIADNSQGLQIKDAGATRSRGELLRKNLTDESAGWQSALSENFQVRRYTFDSRLQSARGFTDLDFEGRSSAIGGALRTAIEQWRGQPVAGVLLFTDGNATDIGAELPPLDGSPPIYPVIVGQDADIQDVSIQKIGVSQTAFEDAPVTIQAEVGASGFAGSEIVARLTEVAALVGSQEGRAPQVPNPSDKSEGVAERLPPKVAKGVSATNSVVELKQRARGAGDVLSFRFQIHPDKPGLHFYELETRAVDEAKNPAAPTREATLINNRQIVMVDRGQEPFRILYVSGRPNWEYKFLNRAIQEDRQVQMVALIRVARREPKFEFRGRAGESSNPLFRGFGRTNEETARYDQPVVIRLNTKDEFELRGGFPKTAEELFRYHAVILDDLEAEFFTNDQMTLLQRFVSERGGGFLMLGGAESFREGKYAATPVGSMLPVYIDRPGDAKRPEELKLTLTREGWLQPWTRLRPTEREEKTRLESMPPFAVLNTSREIKPGASVLATVSGSDDKTYPALVVQRFGLGRSAALLVGDMWYWGLKDEAAQKDLGKAWRQLARWLVSDVPARISVTAQPPATGDSSEVRLVVKVRDEDFKPLDNATVRLTVRPVKLSSQQKEAAANKTPGTDYVQMSAEPSVLSPGTYESTFVVREAGAYSVEAIVTQADGKRVGQAATGWTSDPAAEEFRSLKPNRALLATLAQRTGGEIIAMKDLEKFVRALPERSAPITETWSYPLWHKPLLFLFVLACFVTEWGIRRWKGLP